MHPDVSRLLLAFYGTPWAILPDRLEVMRAVLHRWESGVRLSAAEIRAAVGDAPQVAAERQQRAGQQPGAVAVIPVYGLLAPRIHMVQDVSGEGATSYERIAHNFRKALAAPEIGAIVFDIDSPGGSASMIQELADEIHAARGRKKIVAVANSLAASGAYWLATAAEELVVTPSGEVGSIGIYGAHEDHSAELAAAGIKVTLISAGKFKTEGNPYQPLTEEALAEFQSHVDRTYDRFIKSVARGRGVSAADVRKNYGEGRVVAAEVAVQRGMADRVGTLDETIARLAKSPAAQRPKSREAATLRLAELG